MHPRSETKALARQQLDRRFAALRKTGDFARPQRGWIKAIREALGMSTTQLAGRLRVSQTRVSQIEKAEGGSAIRLQTLKQVAEALDCTLVYALVPNKPLEEMVRDRAANIADLQLARTNHTMRLENQALGSAALMAERDRLIRQLIEGEPRRLWETV
jgi:predicted DNA-binding mobile mystery protein A